MEIRNLLTHVDPVAFQFPDDMSGVTLVIIYSKDGIIPNGVTYTFLCPTEGDEEGSWNVIYSTSEYVYSCASVRPEWFYPSYIDGVIDGIALYEMYV